MPSGKTNFGESAESAILLSAKSSIEAIEDENRYLTRRFGEEGKYWRKTGQWPTVRNDRYFDVIEVQVGQVTLRIYFDVTSTFPSAPPRDDYRKLAQMRPRRTT